MAIKCITFDLDDTLWDCEPVIARAERVFYEWLAGTYPRVVQRYSPEALIDHRREHFAGQPALHHDLTHLRKQWMERLAGEAGYLGEPLVEEGFNVFWRARNEVELYDEVAETLDRLSDGFRIGAITNGNADVHHIGIGHYFDFVVTAADAGAAKPSPAIFQAALDEAGVAATEAVHVGDDPDRDVRGAGAVGMRTIWVNSAMQAWPGGRIPDAEIQTLGELEDVLLSWARR